MSLIKKASLVVLGVWLLLGIAPALLLKWGIAHQGTQWLGARVDIDDAAFSWWPMQLVLTGVTITNPWKPAYNAVSLARVQAEIDVVASLQGTVLLPWVQVEGVSIATERTESGAIAGVMPRRVFVNDDASDLLLPLFDTLPVDAVVNEETARYRDSAALFRELLRDKQSQWAVRIQGLPNDATLAAYRERWASLKKATLKNPKRTPGSVPLEQMRDSLLADLKADTERLQQADADLYAQWQGVQAHYASLKKLPTDSITTQLARLGVSDAAMSHLGQSLVREKIQEWLNTVLGVHQLLVMPGGVMPGGVLPVMENNANAAVPTGKPHILIKKLSLSGEFASGAVPNETQGHISGEILNLSDAPQWLAKPTTMHIEAGGDQLGTVQMSALLDHRTEGKEIDRFNFSLRNAQVQRFPLAWQKSMQVMVQKASLSINLAGSIEQLHRLDVNLSSVFDAPVLEVGVEKADNAAALAMAAAIEQVSAVTVTARASGELHKPILQMTSSLDEVMAAALRREIGSRLLVGREQLQQRLDGVLLAQLAILENDLATSSAVLDDLQRRYHAFDQLLNNLSLSMTR